MPIGAQRSKSPIIPCSGYAYGKTNRGRSGRGGRACCATTRDGRYGGGGDSRRRRSRSRSPIHRALRARSRSPRSSRLVAIDEAQPRIVGESPRVAARAPLPRYPGVVRRCTTPAPDRRAPRAIAPARRTPPCPCAGARTISSAWSVSARRSSRPADVPAGPPIASTIARLACSVTPSWRSGCTISTAHSASCHRMRRRAASGRLGLDPEASVRRPHRDERRLLGRWSAMLPRLHRSNDVLADVLGALDGAGAWCWSGAGAGKTTRVPGAVLDRFGAGGGDIVVLDPRRLPRAWRRRRRVQRARVGLRDRLARSASNRRVSARHPHPVS